MNKSFCFIDFAAVKAAVSLEQILQRYGILDQLKPAGKEGLRGSCPHEFVAYVAGLPDSDVEESHAASKIVKGSKVTSKSSNLTPEERAAKIKTAYELLGKQMKLASETG